MADEQEPSVRDKVYASSDHEVEYFRGMLEKMLRRSREAMFSDSLDCSGRRVDYSDIVQVGSCQVDIVYPHTCPADDLEFGGS